MKTLSIVLSATCIMLMGCSTQGTNNLISDNVRVNQHADESSSPKLESGQRPLAPAKPKIAKKTYTSLSMKVYWNQAICHGNLQPGSLILSQKDEVIKKLSADKHATLRAGESKNIDEETFWPIIFINIENPRGQTKNHEIFWVNKDFLDALSVVGHFKHARPIKTNSS